MRVERIGLRVRDGVKRQGRVALFHEPGTVQGSEAIRKGGLAGVLGDDAGGGQEKVSTAGAAEQGEGGGVLVGGLGGRVKEDEVEAISGFGEPGQKGTGAAIVQGVAGGDPEGAQVLAQGGDGERSLFGEEDVGGSAGDGFDTDGAGSGVEVGEAGALDPGTEDVEEGLAEAVAGGAGGGSAGGDELP